MLEELLAQLRKFGLEYLQIYPSLYPANVVDVKDPQARGRVRVVCPDLGVQTAPLDLWVSPCFPGAGKDRGTFWPPEEGDTVHVFTALGKGSKIRGYIGGFYGYPNNKAELPSELGYASSKLPTRRGFVTRRGHTFVVDDEPGKEAVRLTWRAPASGDASASDGKQTASRSSGDSAKVEFTRSGVNLESSKGAKLTLDVTNDRVVLSHQSGPKIILSSSGIELDASGKKIVLKGTELDVQMSRAKLGTDPVEPIPLGRRLLAWLKSHQHGTPFGPTSPPVLPPPESLLSPSNTTK